MCTPADGSQAAGPGTAIVAANGCPALAHMPPNEILYLSFDDVAAAGPDMAETIALVEAALRDKGAGLTQLPPQVSLHPMADTSFLYAMPAWVPSRRAAGVKWVSGYPCNPGRGLRYISGLIILNDPETGLPLAIVDCAWITAQRAGAVSAIAARRLAPPEAREAALLGAGVQGRSQIRALAAALPTLREVRVFDMRQDAVQELVADLRPELPWLRLAEAAFPEEAVRGADIVVSAGPIVHPPRPRIKRDWLKRGCLGLPIDFDSMWTMEAMHLDRFLVDDMQQYHVFREQGFFQTSPPPDGDLGDLLNGRCPGRTKPGERILSMNLGIAVLDIPLAKLVCERAVDRGLGLRLPR